MFGNPTAMPTKILWDYLRYWSITAFIFFHGRICEQSMYVRSLSRLKRLGEINHFMQSFFQTWHAETEGQPADGYINISGMPVIREMNARLKEEFSRPEFFERFELNLQQLETLATEIVAASGVKMTTPWKDSNSDAIKQNSFQAVFDSTQHVAEQQEEVLAR